jgi:hypothetical protein
VEKTAGIMLGKRRHPFDGRQGEGFRQNSGSAVVSIMILDRIVGINARGEGAHAGIDLRQRLQYCNAVHFLIDIQLENIAQERGSAAKGCGIEPNGFLSVLSKCGAVPLMRQHLLGEGPQDFFIIHDKDYLWNRGMRGTIYCQLSHAAQSCCFENRCGRLVDENCQILHKQESIHRQPLYVLS